LFKTDLSNAASAIARLTAIIESAPTAMVMIDAAGSIVLVNAETEKLFGYARQELLGQSVERLIPTQFHSEHPRLRSQFFAAPETRRMGAGRDLFGLRQDGTEFPVEIGLNPIQTEEGLFVLGVIVDITERKRDEAALRQSEERVRLIVESALDAVVTMNEEGRITGWNPQAETIFGWRLDEALGQRLADLIIPEQHRAAHRQGLLHFLTSGEGPVLNQRLELTALRRGSYEFPVELTISAIQIGEHFEFSAFIRDITERKRLEDRFRATVESAPTAMVMIDAVGAIVLVNAETEKLFGYTRLELLGRNVEVLVPERFRFGHPHLRSQFFAAAAPEARRMGAGRDLFGLRKDGTEFPVEIGLNPIQTREGVFVLSAIVDITERKRLSTALREAKEQLEERVEQRTAQLAHRTQELERAIEALERSNLELQHFAYVASHDLQSPLRSISGFVQLLRAEYAGQLDEQADDWIRRTVQSIQQMQSLIRDLLEYSRVDARSRPFQPVPFREVVADAMGLLKASIHDSGAQVTYDLLPSVVGDRAQLVQLMENLIGNALKYHGHQPPLIHVSAERRENDWVFSVRDNGLGIDPKYHEQIFEIFQRLHDQQEYPGTGIGLAICRRVVHRHGGRIWLASEPGHGSTFYFTLPERTRSGV
jgi:PAS domain S-box-containing protein